MILIWGCVNVLNVERFHRALNNFLNFIEHDFRIDLRQDCFSRLFH